MKKFTFTWWSNVEWAQMTAEVIAPTVEEAETFLRANEKVDSQPFRGSRAEEDSLQLINEEPITIPGFTKSPMVEE